MTFLEGSVKLSNLNPKCAQLLREVDDYPLDYNIFLFKGIDDSITKDNDSLSSFIQSLFDSIPEDYIELIHNPIVKGNLTQTTTSKLQNRLLKLLILERHRRDIDVLNKQLDNKIKYIELEDPLKYEIKSPFYNTFQKSSEDYKKQFEKLALLQSVEYDFEHILDESNDYQSDNDLITQFCNDEVMNFKIKDTKKDEDIYNSEIARVLIPLASQAILMQDQDEGNDERRE